MLHAVIMAGGAGTRFWPASRRDRPKQFLELAGTGPLLRATFDRVVPLVGAARTWVVTSRSMVARTRELLPELPGENVLGEPAGRDTAACAGWAAAVLGARDSGAVCLLLPADHVVGDEEAFRRALAAGGAHVSGEGGLLTFGIRPTRPETGFGYLKLGPREATVDGLAVHRLERFVEKPEPDRARRYVEGGDFLWNSGMFAWRTADLLEEIRRQLPRLAEGLDRIAAAAGTAREAEVLDEVYPTLPRTSVDHGIMEGARRTWTIPVDFPWSDVGSWPALGEVLDADPAGNVRRGRVLAEDTTGSILVGEGPVVVTVGLEGYVVVATPDAVLVVPADRAQEVKGLVGRLADLGWDDVL